MYNTPLLPDAAYTDIGLAKDTTDKVAKDYKVKTNNNNGRTNVNKHTNPTGNYTRFNNKISFLKFDPMARVMRQVWSKGKFGEKVNIVFSCTMPCTFNIQSDPHHVCGYAEVIVANNATIVVTWIL